MPDSSIPSLPNRGEISEVLDFIKQEAAAYLDTVDERPARAPHLEKIDSRLAGPLPEQGDGAMTALRRLLDHGLDGAVHSSGPRCFHFVIGGVTPAALGADWLATALDQMAYAWIASPLATELELISLGWLKELFDLPAAWGGIMTTGATMANFVGLGAARQWWGERHGADIAQDGFGQLPRVPVFSSGYLHASVIKALAMLGIGRSAVRLFSADATGRPDEAALESALRELDGAPAILVANAGEVNSGAFDPIDRFASLAERYGAWLHVDGAFGLFARLSPQTRHLTECVERANSVTVDGHKWLNVPYDCGFSFVQDKGAVGRAFAYEAAYLPDPDDPHPNFGSLGPESSRRARALAVWATLRAYGSHGYRTLVERNLALAQRLAARVDQAADLERLADVPLNIVCFRYNPGGLEEDTLNRLNDHLGQAILEDGRYYAGTTQYGDKIALRPAIVNWRTGEKEIDGFVQLVNDLGCRIILH